MKKILKVLLILVLVAGGMFAMLSVARGMKFRNDTLTACGYSCGGGMSGGSSRIELRTDKDTGEVTLTVAERKTHADREVTTVYKASPEDFEPVRQLVNKYNMYSASKKGRSRLQVLDGDTHSVWFDYSKDDFRVSDSQALSRKELSALWELKEYLCSLAKGEGVTTVEAQEARIVIGGYTFLFWVEEPFDGKLDGVFTEKFEVYPYKKSGTVINKDPALDTGEAPAVSSASGGDIIYDRETGEIVILYGPCEFGSEAYLLARSQSWYQDTAAPHIQGMEGSYSMYLN